MNGWMIDRIPFSLVSVGHLEREADDDEARSWFAWPLLRDRSEILSRFPGADREQLECRDVKVAGVGRPSQGRLKHAIDGEAEGK